MATMTILCDRSNNDIALADGRNITMITGSPACAQNLLQKSLMRLGENAFNITDGVDYFGTIFTPQPNYDAARQTIIRNILECPDVINVQSLNITIEDNIFTFVARVNTIYGPVNVIDSQKF